MTLTPEHARFLFDQSMESVGFLASELSISEWTEHAEDGTLSYITQEVSRLRRLLLLRSAAKVTNAERDSIFAALYLYVKKRFPGTSRDVFRSSFVKNFESQKTSPDTGRRQKPGWKNLTRKIGLKPESRHTARRTGKGDRRGERT